MRGISISRRPTFRLALAVVIGMVVGGLWPLAANAQRGDWHGDGRDWRGDGRAWHGSGTWRGSVGDWHSGRWVHDWHDGRFGWWWYVPGYDWYAYYDTPTYPFPAYPNPAPYPGSPASPYYWYYCASPAGYYPYVQQCAGPWQPVPPGG